MRKILLLCCVGLFWTSNALAHQPSTAYLHIDASQEVASGSWDIPLIDLQLALGLDRNLDQQLSWGEVTAQIEQIESLLQSAIVITQGSTACNLNFSKPLANQIHGDGYVHLAWRSNCQATSPLGINYQLFTDLNADHRALLSLITDQGSQSHVIRRSANNYPLSQQGFISYLFEGVVHIWIGYDHLLFLLLLLLPLIGTNWRQSVKRSLWLISAFTVAHSLSLVVVTLGNLSLPVQLVELSISLSIVAAAGLLVWRPNHRVSAALALALGLLHGLGFANVLRELLANGDNLALHLLAFNLGVEAGQLAVASVVIPLLILAHQWFNYILVVRGAALVSLGIAIYWTAERL